MRKNEVGAIFFGIVAMVFFMTADMSPADYAIWFLLVSVVNLIVAKDNTTA